MLTAWTSGRAMRGLAFASLVACGSRAALDVAPTGGGVLDASGTYHAPGTSQEGGTPDGGYDAPVTSQDAHVDRDSDAGDGSACVYVGPTSCGVLLPGEALVQGQSLSSCDGRFTLAMQTDGNLVLYYNGFGALWASGTGPDFGRDAGYIAVMQRDGNFVLYDANHQPLYTSSYCYFAPDQAALGGGYASTPGCVPSNTQDNPCAYLELQSGDGNLVVYANPVAGAASRPLWATMTRD
jgi:hypothetical protein